MYVPMKLIDTLVSLVVFTQLFKTVGTMKLDRLLGFVVFARVLGCREPDISAVHGACFQNFIVITVSIWDQLFFGMFVANNLYPQHDLDFKLIHD